MNKELMDIQEELNRLGLILDLGCPFVDHLINSRLWRKKDILDSNGCMIHGLPEIWQVAVTFLRRDTKGERLIVSKTIYGDGIFVVLGLIVACKLFLNIVVLSIL